MKILALFIGLMLLPGVVAAESFVGRWAGTLSKQYQRGNSCVPAKSTLIMTLRISQSNGLYTVRAPAKIVASGSIVKKKLKAETTLYGPDLNNDIATVPISFSMGSPNGNKAALTYYAGSFQDDGRYCEFQYRGTIAKK